MLNIDKLERKDYCYVADLWEWAIYSKNNEKLKKDRKQMFGELPEWTAYQLHLDTAKGESYYYEMFEREDGDVFLLRYNNTTKNLSLKNIIKNGTTVWESFKND